MKRSEAETLINNWLDNASEITGGSILKFIETQLNMRRIDFMDESLEIEPWEPEEGWDAYLAEQDRKDRARDFVVTTTNTRGDEIAKKFLDGKEFEDLAKEYNVTIERVRQIVCKARRFYLNKESEKNETK